MKRYVSGMVAALVLLMAVQTLAAEFSLRSPQLADGDVLPQKQVLNGFGCEGGNVSPALSWSGEPQGTKGFAVTVYDPDAPTGSGWWHWLVLNIPLDVHTLVEGAGAADGGALPVGALQGRTDFGGPGYGGACPPVGHGEHRYIFTLWALDVPRLELDGEASGAMIGYFLNAHVLDKATLTLVYGR